MSVYTSAHTCSDVSHNYSESHCDPTASGLFPRPKKRNVHAN